MFLATTALTEYWDKTDDLLAIGPWCLRYDHKKEWDGLRLTVAPSPWGDPRAIEEAADYCGKVIDALLSDLTVLLNHVHGVHFSERYWRILLGPWLIYSVHALYDRYVSLKQILESHQGLHANVLNQADYVTPANTVDFNTLASHDQADVFNLQLFSQILKALNHPGITLKEAPLTQRIAPRHCANWRGCSCGQRGGPRLWPERLFRRAVYGFARMAKPKVMIGGACLDRWNLLRLVGAMAFRGGALPSPQGICCPVKGRDDEMRKGFSRLPAKDEFARVLNQTLTANFPLLFLEGYKAFRKSCLAAWPSRPAVLFSFDGWYTHEVFKFLAAEHGEQGARLVGGQHGEGYGASKVMPTEIHELAVTQRWYSFGWSEPSKTDKVRPLPNPMFLPAHSKRASSERLSDILLIAHSMPRYLHRFESHPPGGRFGEVLEWRERFVKYLPEDLRARLSVRLHHADRGWGQRQLLLDACGSLTFDDRTRSLRERLAECKLAVTDYRGTSLLEMLVENVPMLGFWDPRAYEVRSEAEPYFELLRKAEILWESPKAAADKAAAVYDDPCRWWRSEVVQEARQTFIERFALGRPDWLGQWVEALESEIALSSSGGGQGRHAG